VRIAPPPSSISSSHQSPSRQANAIKPSLLAVKNALLQVTCVWPAASTPNPIVRCDVTWRLCRAVFALPDAFTIRPCLLHQTEANAKKAEMQK
jgi:hypothetical protein